RLSTGHVAADSDRRIPGIASDRFGSEADLAPWPEPASNEINFAQLNLASRPERCLAPTSYLLDNKGPAVALQSRGGILHLLRKHRRHLPALLVDLGNGGVIAGREALEPGFVGKCLRMLRRWLDG